MITQTELKAKLASRLSDLENVGNCVLKGSRKIGESPISHYFFDYSNDISQTAFNLKSYQDQLLASQYFSNPGEIQWSYYLVFLLSEDKYNTMTGSSEFAAIERDKSFTRKFVIKDSELEDFLDVPVLSQVGNEVPVEDLATRWVKNLDDAGLQGIDSAFSALALGEKANHIDTALRELSNKVQEKNGLLTSHLPESIAPNNLLEGELYKRVVELGFTHELIDKVSKTISFNVDDDFTIISKSVEDINDQLSSVYKSWNEEKKAEIELESAKLAIAELSSKIQAESQTLNRLKEAHKVIGNLLSNDGKDKALKVFIEKNRIRIDGIFNRIHSPHEFEGLIAGTTKLRRKGETESTPLNNVSTGQRSALAISVFLALNLSLTKAPPVILIDDPVAHVDDLNTLSFLDFLRELVVKSDRQIFFATASQKLANLIEKKFSFLGKGEFNRFEFKRSEIEKVNDELEA